MKIINH